MKEKLKKYIGEKGVIAFNGPFGVGKTTFINEYINENPEDIFIKFNAWEFDFSDNPKAAFLLSVYKNIYSSLDPQDKFFQQGQKGWKYIRALIKNAAAHKGLSVEGADSKNEIAFKDFIATDELIKNIRENIQSICESTDHNVVLIIDDLDRARPDFSLEIFEIAKHIFDVENLSVILVYNKTTMDNIIKLRFGDIQGETYLGKYIDRVLDFDAKNLYEIMLQKFGLPTHLSSIIFKKLNNEFPVSWREISKVNKYNDCESVLGGFYNNGLISPSHVDIILFSIIAFFRWFKNEHPFIEEGDQIQVKEEFRKSIMGCFKNVWFAQPENTENFPKYDLLQKLIKSKKLIHNEFKQEISGFEQVFTSYIK